MLHRLSVLIATAFLLIFCASAMAQWQVPNHYVPIGKGPGVVGFGSATTGTGGSVLVDQGAGADPVFQPMSGNCSLTSAGYISCIPLIQMARNGSFAIAQRAMPTTNDTYSLDGWRLEMQNANGVVISQDTTDVPVPAGYAAKMVVGTGNNGKFGLFSIIENVNMLRARGTVVSLLVPLKATAGLTSGAGKIRICIAQWTGTADNGGTKFPNPIASWNAEGTNPTLSGSWSCANTPTAIAVSTTWGNYRIENVTISASATNLALFIWSDATTTTTTTDVLRIGGYVTFIQGAYEPSALIAPYNVELAACQRYYETIGFGNGNSRYPVVFGVATAASQIFGVSVSFAVTKRIIPILTAQTPDSLTNATGATADGPTIGGFRFYVSSVASGTVAASYITSGITADSDM